MKLCLLLRIFCFTSAFVLVYLAKNSYKSPYIKSVGDLRNSSTLSGNFQAEKFVEYNITVKSNQALSYVYGRLKRRFSKRSNCILLEIHAAATLAFIPNLCQHED